MIQVGLLLLLCIEALTQVPGSNEVDCPDVVGALTDFDWTKFMNTWYEVQKFFPILGNARKCVAAKYAQNADSLIEVVLGRVDEVSDEPKAVQGTVTFVGSIKVANLVVKIPQRAPQLYKILDIDYNNYFVAFSCYDRSSHVWIFSRKRVLDDKYLQKAYAALAKYPTLEKSFFKATNQTDCPDTV